MPEPTGVLDGRGLRRLAGMRIRSPNITSTLADVGLDPSRIDVDRGREAAEAFSAALSDAIRDAIDRLPSERRRRQQRMRMLVQATALLSFVAAIVGVLIVAARRAGLLSRGIDVERRLNGSPPAPEELRAVGPGPQVPVEPASEPIAVVAEPGSRSEDRRSEEPTEPLETTGSSGVSSNGVLNASER